MKTKIACVLVILAFVVVAIPNVSATADTDLNETNNTQYDYSKIEFTNRSVAILSDSNVGESISSALSQSTSKLDISDNFNTAKAKDITVIDGDWAASKSISTVENGIKSLIENNNAVIVIDDNADLIKESGANVGLVGFAQDSQAYGMINISTGQTYCYSVGGMEDINDAVLLAYNWADKTINETNTATTSSSNDWTYRGNCNIVKNESKGNVNITTQYYQYNENDPDYNYYYTHYMYNAAPHNDHSKRFMNIYNEISSHQVYGKYQSLIDHGPTLLLHQSKVGSHNVELSGNVRLNNNFVPISVNKWSYGDGVTTLNDECDVSKNIFNYVHRIAEDSSTALHNTLVEPGSLICVEENDITNGDYHCIEKYSTTFCDVVIPLVWNNNFKEYNLFNNIIVYDKGNISSVYT